MTEESKSWNAQRRTMECWVCGAHGDPDGDVVLTVRWLFDHQHSRIEREAARIVEQELGRADREAERRNRRRR